MKTKKAIKYIIKHPELFTDGDLKYARLIKKQRDLKKQNGKCQTDLKDNRV
jgi:hypothetical protein